MSFTALLVFCNEVQVTIHASFTTDHDVLFTVTAEILARFRAKADNLTICYRKKTN